MKKEGELRNNLRAQRMRFGLSQQDLAVAAGIARQTIGGIESGTYALSLTIALRLAKTLGCAVEDLFWLEGDLPVVEATLVANSDAAEREADATDAADATAQRVALAQIEGRWIATPLTGAQAFRREMIPADGLRVAASPGDSPIQRRVQRIQLLDTPEALAQTIVLAGCTPALSLWARSAERWYPGLRVHWTHANSTDALARLSRGEAHIAGVHLIDETTGEENAPFVRRALPNVPMALATLGIWEEGLLVASGNPQNVLDVRDLSRVRLINREAGAGARLLLDSRLRESGIAPASLPGYDDIAGGHYEVAQAIADGHADAGISASAVAAAFGLSFVPLRSVRCELALRKTALDLPPIQHLLSTLHHHSVRTQLAVVGGYDITQTGEIRMVE